MNQDEKIKGIFLQEATEHLETLMLGLSNINITVANYDQSQEIFRAFFCLKGGSAMLGFYDVQKIVHGLENCFSMIRQNSLVIDQPIQLLFMEVCQILGELFTAIAQTNHGQLSGSSRAIAPKKLISLQHLEESVKQLYQGSEKN